MGTAWTQIKSSSAIPDMTPAVAAAPAEPPPQPLPTRETFVARAARFSLDHLIVPAQTREQLEILLDKLRYQKVLFEDWNLQKIAPGGRRMAINLYGPPGTGKTFCAEAIANHLNRPILDVNYAELESKFVGETAKNIVAAFQAAREDNAVLFFDEADTILSKRLTDIRQSADYGVNQARSVMLKELEGFDGVVVFATNLARNYDGAFVRRILGHIHFPLPDLASRKRLWQLYLIPELPCAPDVDPDQLAELAEGLSGGEMQNALIAAATAAVRRTGDRQHLTLADFATQIDHVKRAKRDIGNYDYGEPPDIQTTRRTVELSELPEDVRQRALADS
ncbi:MAG: AAA family ATPase [Bradymonadaceae bacterium]|nr:AAA family ATPase [Lujinxingiaceae bacterium]